MKCMEKFTSQVAHLWGAQKRRKPCFIAIENSTLLWYMVLREKLSNPLLTSRWGALFKKSSNTQTYK